MRGPAEADAPSTGRVVSPFFRAWDRFDARVDVYVPGARDGDPEEVLARSMSPPPFPTRPSELRGRWEFRALEQGEAELVRAAREGDVIDLGRP